MDVKKISRSIVEYLKATLLFSGVEEDDLTTLMSLGEHSIKELSAGDELEVNNALVIVISGALEAYKSESGKRVFLKNILSREVTGIATLFDTSGQYISTLLAKKDSEILILTEDFILNALRTSPIFAERFSRLLCEKLRYLNSRIDTYTQPSTENKLLEYIKSSAKVGDDHPCIEMSMSSLSSALGVGRASLYRALSSLEESGVISKDGKKIYLLK